MEDQARSTSQMPPLKQRWAGLRNRVLASPRFQQWMEALPFTRPVARRKATQMFDLLAGFTYTQTLFAFVESGLIDWIAQEAATTSDVAKRAGFSQDAALRLLRASAALELAEEVAPDRWMLGQQGAALLHNYGARAMIRHHRLLYRDLVDPLALLRDDRRSPTELSQFWSYAASTSDDPNAIAETAEYSRLMAASHHLISSQALAAYNFGRHKAVLDIGGGHGAFLDALADSHPDLKLGLFDLPEVAANADATRFECHSGNFFSDSLPQGYDCITLSRIVHDHDDEPVMKLLTNLRSSMDAAARLIIVEPMSQTRGAQAMGDAYFGLYLWAMRSGRPRSAQEIRQLLKAAGFSKTRLVRTRQPVITQIIVCEI
jgi:demethylspheroidene O-methyltransferase